MKIKKALLSILAISAVSSLSFAAPQDEYIIKVLMDQSASTAPEEVVPPESTENKDYQNEWMSFFHKKNTMLDIGTLDQWGPRLRNAFLTQKGLRDSDLPQVPFGLDNIGSVLFANNKFTNINFMKGVKYVRGDFMINMNTISDLTPMSEVTGVSGWMILDGLPLRNLNGLQKLRHVGTFNIRIPTLTDISAISNIESASMIWVDNPSQYKVKPAFGSPFCNGLDSGKIIARGGNYATGKTSAELCQ